MTILKFQTKPLFFYPDALKKSIKFYYAQRSGIIKDKKIPWRGSSALEDQGENGESLVGGFYDAGDHLKLTFPMAYSMTVLAWGILEYWDVYQALGVRNEAIGIIKWGCDWLIKANPEDFVLYGQVGDNKTDHSQWESAETIKGKRKTWKLDKGNPGTDLTSAVSAAMAASALVFERMVTDPDITKERDEILESKNAANAYTVMP